MSECDILKLKKLYGCDTDEWNGCMEYSTWPAVINDNGLLADTKSNEEPKC